MDKNDNIIDISSHLDAEVRDDKAPQLEVSFHSNPILKKLFAFNIRKKSEKLSLKDLFR